MGRNNSDSMGGEANIIVQGTTLKGQISAKGALRVDGEIEGNIKCDGKLVVGEKGRILGEIFCVNAEVMGEINGKLNVEQLLTIKATAQVEGEIKTSKLSIEPNAIFKGTCSMGNESKPNPVKKS